MIYEFVLPDLGEGITEGEIRKWLVKEGDAVQEHQDILELETDKAIVEIPSPKQGTVLQINKDEGEVVNVGEVLLKIELRGKEEGVESEAGERGESVSVVGTLPEEGEMLAMPAVRALAKKLGVSLKNIHGSGPAGSITRDDVTEASEKAKRIIAAPSFEKESSKGLSDRIPMKGIRRTIAKNLILSQRTTAFVTGMDEADITELWDIRQREKQPLIERDVHLTFLPFFIKAVQHALVDHPLLNASVDEEKEEIIVKKYYSMGIAVDTAEGLMVPVIRDVDKKSILDLAKEIQELSRKARERKIKPDEMKGSTFTITNYGHFGGLFATPIINYPDVAILGTGRISEKPWVKNGQIVIRRILPLSLTFDHRVTDGVDSARFLSRVIRYLEDPALLFIEST